MCSETSANWPRQKGQLTMAGPASSGAALLSGLSGASGLVGFALGFKNFIASATSEGGGGLRQLISMPSGTTIGLVALLFFLLPFQTLKADLTMAADLSMTV